MGAGQGWGRTDASRAIGRRIREERVQAGHYRAEFAALVGTTPRQVGRWEVSWPISDVRLAKVANALGRNFAYMKTGQGDKVLRDGPPSHTIDAGSGQVVIMTRADVERIVRQAVAEAMRQVDPPPAASLPRRRVSKRAGRGARRG